MAQSTIDQHGLRHHPRIAIAYMLGQALLLTTMDAFVKWLTTDYSVGQIAFMRYFIGLFMVLGVTVASGHGLASLKTRRLKGHVLRSCFNLLTMLTFYLALQLLPLPNAVCIGMASLIFVTALSIPMLREKVGLGRWIAVGIGFLGIVLIVQPKSTGIEWGAIFALVSAMGWALTQVASRQLSNSEPSHRIIFYYALIVVIVLGAAMPFYWVTPNLRDLGLFVGVALIGTSGQFCLNQAFRYGQASLIAPFDYTGLVWATLLGAFIWGDYPNALMLAGAAIVIACCLYILRAGARGRADAPMEP